MLVFIILCDIVAGLYAGLHFKLLPCRAKRRITNERNVFQRATGHDRESSIIYMSRRRVTD